MQVEDWLGEDNTLGIEIWNRKYRNGDESFDAWLDRVSGGDYDIRKLILEKKFLFGGRILANRGVECRKYTLSNCYVLAPPEDSIESIFETAGKLARTFSYGGGVGVDLSKLAPKGAKVNNAAGQSTGAVSFTDLYSMITGLIGQHGRRGALMLSLSCTHPDLEDFISLKTDVNRVTKANLSVRVNDRFMECVERDAPFVLNFKRPETDEMVTRTVSARDVFKKLCDANYDYGEPGILFWDRIKEYNLNQKVPNFEYAGVNPCAEQPLPAGGSCLLGSINLSEFVNDGKFDFDGFKQCVRIGVYALNQVLWEGMNMHPLEEQRDACQGLHQIGLGIMGLGDMFIKMGIKYGSPESLDLVDRIGNLMFTTAYDYSAFLEHTKAYARCMGFQYLGESDIVKAHGLEPKYLTNSQLLTIAPTGTISTMIGVSGGIEPIFAKSYTRRTTSLSDGDEYHKVYPKVISDLMEKLKVDENHLPDYVVTASDIPWRHRVDMQATWQKHIDASISSTINLPEDFPKDEIFDIYMYAWKSGCKGLTLFRQGCKRDAILTDNTAVPKTVPITVESTALVGKKRKLMTGCGSLHCTAFFDADTGDLKEVFLNRGSDGGCMSYMNAMSRLASLSLRSGCDADEVINQLKSVSTCPSYAVRRATKGDTSKGSSCPMAVAYALQDMCDEMRHVETRKIPDDFVEVKNPCPKCGTELQFSGGCNTCPNCGWSKCD